MGFCWFSGLIKGNDFLCSPVYEDAAHFIRSNDHTEDLVWSNRAYRDRLEIFERGGLFHFYSLIQTSEKRIEYRDGIGWFL